MVIALGTVYTISILFQENQTTYRILPQLLLINISFITKIYSILAICCRLYSNPMQRHRLVSIEMDFNLRESQNYGTNRTL